MKLEKTNGIILHTTKFSETSLIVKIITPDFGVQSYIVNGVRGKKSKFKAPVFQPLTLVDMVVSNTDKAKLQRISEINIHYPYNDIPYNIIKSSIALFLNEVLYKAIKEQHSDENLFEFLKNSLQLLDLNHHNCSNFHVFFMVQLSRYLGFFPEGQCTASTPLFDLLEGRFVGFLPNHPNYLNPVQSKLLNQLINGEYGTIHQLEIDKYQRRQLLQSLIKFYQLHITSFGEIKSLEVLEQVIA
ncbi:MAG: DNA repair protein RecO [Bacteroidetes bacterium]|nr:DNA repair protein RecO [Bacteroidota bacterium]